MGPARVLGHSLGLNEQVCQTEFKMEDWFSNYELTRARPCLKTTKKRKVCVAYFQQIFRTVREMAWNYLNIIVSSVTVCSVVFLTSVTICSMMV